LKIELAYTYQEINPAELKEKTCVVIDTLRATSTIITALHHGCSEIVTAESISKALALHLKKEDYIFGGELCGKNLTGFDKGNSPLEYTKGIHKQKVILFTTNGTKTLARVKEAKEVIICALLNVEAVAKWLATSTNRSVLICCAGTRGKWSLEDFYTAGALVSKLLILKKNLLLSKKASKARYFYCLAKNIYNGQIKNLFSASANGKRLASLGMSDDINFCSRESVYEILPVYRNGVIKQL